MTEQLIFHPLRKTLPWCNSPLFKVDFRLKPYLTQSLTLQNSMKNLVQLEVAEGGGAKMAEE